MAQVIDMRHPHWGHNFGKTDKEEIAKRGDVGKFWTISTPLPQPGDFIVFPKFNTAEKHGHPVFQFKTVDPCGNPRDMAFCDLEYTQIGVGDDDEFPTHEEITKFLSEN